MGLRAEKEEEDALLYLSYLAINGGKLGLQTFHVHSKAIIVNVLNAEEKFVLEKKRERT